MCHAPPRTSALHRIACRTMTFGVLVAQLSASEVVSFRREIQLGNEPLHEFRKVTVSSAALATSPCSVRAIASRFRTVNQAADVAVFREAVARHHALACVDDLRECEPSSGNVLGETLSRHGRVQRLVHICPAFAAHWPGFSTRRRDTRGARFERGGAPQSNQRHRVARERMPAGGRALRSPCR